MIRLLVLVILGAIAWLFWSYVKAASTPEGLPNVEPADDEVEPREHLCMRFVYGYCAVCRRWASDR